MVKQWLIASAVLMFLVVGCQATGTTPKGVSTTPGAGEIKSPWTGFPEGAWVQYKVLDPRTGNEMYFRDSIHNIVNGQANVVTAIKAGDKWQMGSVKPVSLMPMTKPTGKPSTPVSLSVGAKSLTCKLVEMPLEMKGQATVVKTYMCDDVPGGVVQREMGGKVIWQALDFGNKMEVPTMAEVSQMKNPWAGFPKGSWVEYKVSTPEGTEVRQKFTLIEVSEDKAVIEPALFNDGKWEAKDAEVVSLLPIGRSAKAHQFTTLKIGDKEVDCTYVDMTIRMGDTATVIKQWMSDAVPGGMVRKEMGGKCVKEVVDFGTK